MPSVPYRLYTTELGRSLGTHLILNKIVTYTYLKTYVDFFFFLASGISSNIEFLSMAPSESRNTWNDNLRWILEGLQIEPKPYSDEGPIDKTRPGYYSLFDMQLTDYTKSSKRPTHATTIQNFTRKSPIAIHSTT